MLSPAQRTAEDDRWSAICLSRDLSQVSQRNLEESLVYQVAVCRRAIARVEFPYLEGPVS
jgi:hypothetical protein